MVVSAIYIFFKVNIVNVIFQRMSIVQIYMSTPLQRHVLMTTLQGGYTTLCQEGIA